eukprot:gene6230-4473_t
MIVSLVATIVSLVAMIAMIEERNVKTVATVVSLVAMIAEAMIAVTTVVMIAEVMIAAVMIAEVTIDEVTIDEVMTVEEEIAGIVALLTDAIVAAVAITSETFMCLWIITPSNLVESLLSSSAAVVTQWMRWMHWIAMILMVELFTLFLQRTSASHQMKCDSVMNVWITVVAEVTALLVVETETTVNALNEVLLARLLNHALLAKRETSNHRREKKVAKVKRDAAVRRQRSVKLHRLVVVLLPLRDRNTTNNFVARS